MRLIRVARVAGVTAAALVLGLGAAGCGAGSSGAAPASSGAPAAHTGTLTVLAAASLTEAFGTLKTEFEQAHPGVTVKFNFAGSSTLAQQIVNGAPADVFASADDKNMAKVAGPKLVAAPPQPFAGNVLEIAVAPGNPKHITGLSDLTKPGVTLVTCAAAVPCGSATKQVEQSSGVTLKPVSEETDVKNVLNKVAAGEADAGLVYVTDVNSAKGKVTGVPFPESAQAVNVYPIAVLKDAPQPQLANDFVDLVRGPEGQKALGAVGFRTP